MGYIKISYGVLVGLITRSRLAGRQSACRSGLMFFRVFQPSGEKGEANTKGTLNSRSTDRRKYDACFVVDTTVGKVNRTFPTKVLVVQSLAIPSIPVSLSNSETFAGVNLCLQSLIRVWLSFFVFRDCLLFCSSSYKRPLITV